MIVPVILSGGSGTRLWPLSTPQRPKQFLPLTGTDTLFQQTLQRVADRAVYAPPVVVANAAHEALCLEELASHPGAELLLEPLARNTAAAIAMAARLVHDVHGPGALLLVMPSDHLIGDVAAFHEAVATGIAAAEAGRLVTFGVRPTGPETGYGYIEAGAGLADAAGAFRVVRFKEKPELEVAKAMVADGKHFWNGGIFLYSVATFLDELVAHAPQIADRCEQAMAHAERRGGIVYPSADALKPCPDLSVDYAVMERSDRVAMVPLSARWSDVGSWDALAELDPPAAEPGLITAVNSENCYVRSGGLKIGLLGVEDLVVVATGDRVLIMRKGESQHIRQLVAEAAAY